MPSFLNSLFERFLPFHEGQRIDVHDGADWNTADLLALGLEASLAMGGKSVRCTGIVPGASMRVTAGPLSPFDDGDKAVLLDEIWNLLLPHLVEWLRAPGFAPPVVLRIIGSQDSRICCAWDTTGRLKPGVSEIVVRYNADYAATYAKSRRRQPLIEHAPDEVALQRRRLIVLRRLLVAALNKSRQTVGAKYASLPVHVRFRLTGAMAAWQTLQRERGLDCEVSAAAPDPQLSSITRIVRDAVALARHILPNGLINRPVESLPADASQASVWSAFEVRGGQFYEPSLALHRLLGEAYIADDVPIGAVHLPMDTLCIVPEASSRDTNDITEAIVLFRNDRQLSCAAWTCRHMEGRVPVYSFNVVELPLGDPDRTIRELLLDVHGQQPVIDDELVVSVARSASNKRFWQQTLDYAIKMLLYLSVRDAHVVPHRDYSNADRALHGLGKRRRAERLEAIEQLYDRYVVGPALLDEELAQSMPSTSPQREVKSHWRRPHFKMQRHGPNGGLRKLVFIGPTIVRADRLSL